MSRRAEIISVVLGTALGGFLFLSAHAHAATLINQADGSAESWQIQAGASAYRTGQTFLASANFQISDIRLEFDNSDTSGITFKLVLYDLGTAENLNGSAILLSSSTPTTVLTGGSPVEFTFSFPDAPILTAGHYYFISYGQPNIAFNGAGGGSAYVRQGAADYFTGNSYGYWQILGTATYGVSAIDDYLIINGTSTAPTVSFAFPVNGTTTADFSNWQLSYSNAPTSSTSTVSVSYSGVAGTFYDAYTLTFPTSTGSIAFPKNKILTDIATTTAWTAQATLLSSSTYATSPIITFYVLPQGAGGVANAAIASSTCSGFGFLGEPVCNAVLWLFVPPNSVFGLYGGLQKTLSTKPPFGYFTSAQIALNNFSEGTSSISVMNASTAADFAPEFAPFRNGLAWILWFGFGIWSFHRIREFDF